MLIAIAGTVLAGFGAVQGLGEMAPYVSAGIGSAERFGAIAEARYEPGDSAWSKALFLGDCLDLPGTTLALVQPAARRDAFASHCRDTARAIVADMPTHSTAWLVDAASSARLDDPAGMRAGLLASARTAPDLAWLAERRSALALAQLPELGEAEQALYRRDLAVLLESRRGTEALATRYIRNPAERETITGIVEAAPGATQQRFLGRVQALTAARQAAR